MEKPILFNTEMAGAILEGRKTCTRRIVKPQPAGQLYPLPKDSCYPGCWGCNESNAVIRAPYQPGDILYVREAWRVAEAWNGSSRGCRIEYKAGGEETFDDIIRLPDKEGKWKPSIHLPKAAARIFLRVKSVRVEIAGHQGRAGEAGGREWLLGQAAPRHAAIYRSLKTRWRTTVPYEGGSIQTNLG